jgi:hypothetical protein
LSTNALDKPSPTAAGKSGLAVLFAIAAAVALLHILTL